MKDVETAYLEEVMSKAAYTDDEKIPSLLDMFYDAYKSGEKTMDEIPMLYKDGIKKRIKADAKSAEEQAVLIAEEQAAATEETKEEKKSKAKAASKKKESESTIRSNVADTECQDGDAE